MADKARSLFPISITFSEGELPTAKKIAGIARQAKAGLSVVEYALGDLWNQSGDKLLQSAGVSAYALMIPNLARLVGYSKLLNPRVPDLSSSPLFIQEYTYSFAADTVGDYEAQLTFPVNVSSSFTWNGTGTPVAGSIQANIEDVQSTGQWYLDYATGFIHTYDPIAADWTLTYWPDVYGELESSGHNVIPDPDTDSSYAFQGVKIEYVNGTDNSQGYYIFLPPRGPLDSTRLDRSAQDNIHTPAHTNNFQTDPLMGSRLFWQDDSVDADTSSNAEHYRYLLPSIITDNWSLSSALPQGMLYLWDPNNTGTIIEGVRFTAENAVTPRKYVLVATGTNLDSWLSTYGTAAGYSVANMQSSSHAASLYPSAGLKLITVGSDITSAVNILMKNFMNHKHGDDNLFPTTLVNHSSLKGLFDKVDIQTFWMDWFGGVSFRYDPSQLRYDDHPQYLHRSGTDWFVTTFLGVTRDKYNNGMFGDLMFLSTNSGSNHQNLLGDSKGILFGGIDLLTHPRLFYDYSANVVSLTNKKLATTGYKPQPTSIATYGYSAASESAGYGPLRYHFVSPSEFFHYSTIDTLGLGATPTTQQDNYRIYWNSGGGGHEAVTSLFNGVGGGVDWTFMRMFANLPFAKWCIVNVICSVTGLATAIAGGAFYCDIGYQDTTHGAGLPFGGLLYSVDLNNIFPGAGTENYPAAASIFDAYVSSTAPLIEIDNTLGVTTGNKIPWIRFRNVAGSNLDYLIKNFHIVYRVKEF